MTWVMPSASISLTIASAGTEIATAVVSAMKPASHSVSDAATHARCPSIPTSPSAGQLTRAGAPTASYTMRTVPPRSAGGTPAPDVPPADRGGHVHAITRDPADDPGMDWLGLHEQEPSSRWGRSTRGAGP